MNHHSLIEYIEWLDIKYLVLFYKWI